MSQTYKDVTVRFLRSDEQLIPSSLNDMPLVLEANETRDLNFLQKFVKENSAALLRDIAQHGAVLLRGFDVTSASDFEQTILSVPEFKGMSDVFMAEEGRIQVGDLKYVLHTNAIYKTGGTLYLGGFHTENYYSTDVPGFICFFCLQPSKYGGETGLINTQKVYDALSAEIKEKLEKNTFFAAKWLVSEVAERYNISSMDVEKICQQFNLPLIGKGKHKFVFIYKPSVLIHPVTKRRCLEINFFELPLLNKVLQQRFMPDYQGKRWFWNRVVWRLPRCVFHFLENAYMSLASLFYSPKAAIKRLRIKIRTRWAMRYLPPHDEKKLEDCFTARDLDDLAQNLRNNYVSCLWQAGDILLVDNKQVAHAGMPGSGKRIIRAMICNPLSMQYTQNAGGEFDGVDSLTETIGFYMGRVSTEISN